MDWIPRLLAITSTAFALLAFEGRQADTPSIPTPQWTLPEPFQPLRRPAFAQLRPLPRVISPDASPAGPILGPEGACCRTAPERNRKQQQRGE